MKTKHRKPQWYYNTEVDIRQYDQIKKNIELIREDIILSGCSEVSELPAKGTVSDSTGNKAVKLAHVGAVALFRSEWVIAAVDRTLRELPECRAIFDLYYRLGYQWHRVCADAHIEKTTFYGRKDKFVDKVAEYLGNKY